jgi:hypothetical protein
MEQQAAVLSSVEELMSVAVGRTLIGSGEVLDVLLEVRDAFGQDAAVATEVEELLARCLDRALFGSGELIDSLLDLRALLIAALLPAPAGA